MCIARHTPTQAYGLNGDTYCRYCLPNKQHPSDEKPYELDGESDTPHNCSKCGRPLITELTEQGVQYVLEHIDESLRETPAERNRIIPKPDSAEMTMIYWHGERLVEIVRQWAAELLDYSLSKQNMLKVKMFLAKTLPLDHFVLLPCTTSTQCIICNMTMPYGGTMYVKLLEDGTVKRACSIKCLVQLLDEFTRDYLACALWSSVDDDQEPLDTNYSLSDLSYDALTQAQQECYAFIQENKTLLEKYAQHRSIGHAGHDFWLSRNGHGSGFFDRNEVPKIITDRLQEAAHKAGQRDLYVGGDKLIHMMQG